LNSSVNSSPRPARAKEKPGGFCDLEGDVCDLERMSQIAQDLIVQCVAREDGYRELELSSFAVMELAKMLRNFKGRYYKRWHGELAGAS
jgi:hypothetical protein